MRRFLAVLAATSVLFIAAPAQARGIACDERDAVLEHLAKKYQETPIAVGVTNSGGLVEVLTDGKGGTWTIIVTTPQGTSCLVAAGQGWQDIRPVATDPRT